MVLRRLFSAILFTSCLLSALSAPKGDDEFEDYYREFIYDYELDSHEDIIIKPEGGYIESEGFPKQYQSDANYTWTLIAPKENRIRVLITDLRLERSDGCLYDYLAIFDGSDTLSPKIAQLCDRHYHLVYSSTGPEMTIMFISDSVYEEPGFHLEYMIEMENHCNVTLSNKEGTITSPNYPDNYDDDTSCWTIIKAPNPEEQVLINFNTVKMEYGENCDYDYVEIFDGVSKTAKSLGRFCDTPLDAVILSTSGALLVHFHSDHLINNVGFSLKYSIISPFKPMKNPDANNLCLWEMGKLNGTIRSPGYPHHYEPDEECLFLLEAPVNQKIALTMGKIVMDGHDNCHWDYVEVRDGHDPDSELIGKFCGRPIDPYQTVTSSSNKMWVKFVSDSQSEFQGFIARYKVVNKAPSVSSCEYCHETKFEEPLVVSTKPQNATLTKEQKHMFNCISNAETKPTWMKDFVPLVLGEQMSLPGLNLLTNHSLAIESMSWLLEGIYTCTIVSSTDIQVYNAWVNYVPSAEEKACDIKFNVIPQSIVTIEGAYTFLRCSTANLHTQITWTKDNVILTENTDPRFRIILPGLLLIHPLLPHDTGNYKCIAKKYDGCIASVSASVGVKHKPDVGCGIAAVKKNPKKPYEEHGKIVGGEKSVEGSNPWQAMLYHAAEGSFCGGSIVNIEWVVTAAHCFRQFSDIFLTTYELKLEDVTVKLGKYDSLRKEPNEQVFKMKQVLIHSRYNSITYDNDIALIHLERPIVFNAHVSPICLGHDDLLTDNVYSKQVLGVVSGWGRTESGGRIPRYLREVSLPVVDQDTCIKSISKGHFTDNMFCAGFAQQMRGDSCQGDSGGPFAVHIKERWYLAGVVSWGEGCAAEGKYGFYTKAGNYYNWILGTIQQGSLA